jgi:hypothetical protein
MEPDMTTLSVSRPRVKPTPVRRTTVLFDSGARHAAPKSFGSGLLASRPTFTHTRAIEDEAWAAQAFGELSDARDAEEFDQELEFRAAIAEAQDRLERGTLL